VTCSRGQVRPRCGHRLLGWLRESRSLRERRGSTFVVGSLVPNDDASLVDDAACHSRNVE
jgi:hypothetical protein